METNCPHLLIEDGPEKGREITIPASGARIGRSEENDIRIADAAMSRFQCRMYFRDGFLHLMDLGSTNESLVNNQPASDVALRFGDEVLIGESLIKVINDGLHEASSASKRPQHENTEPEAAPAPIIFNLEGDDDTIPSSSQPADIPEIAPSKTSTLADVDLGLGRREELLAEKESSPRRANLSLLLVTLVTMLVVFGIGLFILTQSAPPPVVVDEEEDNITVIYEKIIAGSGNIFRYALEIHGNGEIAVEVHDLRQQRNVIKQEKISAKRIERLQNQLLGNKDSLFALQDDYEGLPVGDHESYNLTIIYGKEAKTIRVANQLEPDSFKQAREQIESFANNELSLFNFDLPPELLREKAAESWANAQNLYAAREVKNSNLWQATQMLKDVTNLLATIEPKPEYYKDAVTLRQEWLRDLDNKIKDIEFEAMRAKQMGEKQRALELNRRILATYPDPDNTEYKQAYNRLTQIEQELN